LLLDFSWLGAERATIFAVRGSWGVGEQLLSFSNKFTPQVSHETKFAGFPKSGIGAFPPHRFLYATLPRHPKTERIRQPYGPDIIQSPIEQFDG
jgi:hypothetical protein